jgi:hypothetical protein
MSMADAHDSKKRGEQRPRSSVRAGPRRKAAAPAQATKSCAAAGAQQVGMVLVWWGCAMHVCSCRPPLPLAVVHVMLLSVNQHMYHLSIGSQQLVVVAVQAGFQGRQTRQTHSRTCSCQ